MASGTIATLGDLPSAMTLADLKNMEYRAATVSVAGRTAPGDGFAGDFDWYPGDETPADDVIVVECDAGEEDGRYKRRLDGIANPLWWNDLTTPSLTTAAFRAAAATGLHVRVPERVNEINGGFQFVANGQALLGLGLKSVLTPIGNFDILEIAGAATGCFVDNFFVDGPLQTGGYIVAVRNGSRVKIDRIIAISPYNGFYAEQFNQLTFGSIWLGNCRGQHISHLYGSPTKRSDIAVFENLTASAAESTPEDDRATLLTWDGNVHTVDTSGLRGVNCGRGIVTLNSAGGSWPNQTPAFLRGTNVQVDYPTFEALKLDIGFDMNIQTPYFANSRKEAGVVIGEQCAIVSIVGGINSGHAKEGIIPGGKDITVAGLNNVGNSWSSIGKYAGIRVTGTARGITFTGVRSGRREGIGATHSYGIDVEPGATDIAYDGGSLEGNLIEAWRDRSGGGNGNFRVSASGSLLSVASDWLFGSVAGLGATFAPEILAGAIPTVSVADGGRHYSFAPALYAFDPAGTGVGWTGHAVVANGVVTSAVTDTPGTGYSADTIIYARPVSIYPTTRPYSSTADASGQFGASGAGHAVLLNDQGLLADFFNAANAVNFPQFYANATGGPVIMRAEGADPHIVLQLLSKGASGVQLLNDQGIIAEFVNAAAAANYLQFYANATGQSVLLKAVGADAAVNLILFSKGSQSITLRNDVGVMADFRTLPDAVNFLTFYANAAGGPVFIQPDGSDANIDVVLRGKGTGLPNLHIPQAETAGASLGFIHLKINDVIVAVEIKATA